jgi:cytoskeleton protein RodZ
MHGERPASDRGGGRDGRASRGADRSTSIGLYLSGQRRLRGISLDELAAQTKIPRRNIERLEAGAFDASPDGFTRGFVRTVAEALGLDPDEAVMRLMTEPAAEDAERARRQLRRAAWLRVVAAVAALAGAALLLRLLVTLWQPGAPAPEPTLVYRRDAVRQLAVGEGEEAAAGAPRAAPAPETAPTAASSPSRAAGPAPTAASSPSPATEPGAGEAVGPGR